MREVALMMTSAMAAVTLGAGAPAATAAAVERCFGRVPTIVGTAGNDRLVGTEGRDVIQALGGVDDVKGGLGDDLICLGDGGSEPSEILEVARGGAGDDRISGGAGADVALGNTGNDRLVGDEGWDNLRGGRGHDVATDSAGPNGYLYGGPGRDRLVGSEQRDEFSDDKGNDTIVALGGDDQIVLENGGVDRIDAGEGSDIIWIGDFDAQEHLEIDLQEGIAQGEDLGTDHLTSVEDVLAWCDPCDVTGSAAANDLTAGSGVIRGLGGDDTLRGQDLHGGDGDDLLYGGTPDDELRGGPGDDSFVPYEGDNTVDGGDGSDTVRFTDRVEVDLAAGTARRRGGDWADTLLSIENVWGSGAGDRIFGDDGDNVLLGDWPERGLGSGDDYIDGRGGTDALNGRGGQDTCVNGEDVENCEA